MKIKKIDRLGVALAVLIVIGIVCALSSTNVEADVHMSYDCECVCQKAHSLTHQDDYPLYGYGFCDYTTEQEVEDLVEYLESQGIDCAECVIISELPDPCPLEPDTPHPGHQPPNDWDQDNPLPWIHGEDFLPIPEQLPQPDDPIASEPGGSMVFTSLDEQDSEPPVPLDIEPPDPPEPPEPPDIDPPEPPEPPEPPQPPEPEPPHLPDPWEPSPPIIC